MNRSDFSNIQIGEDNCKEEVWLKKLRNILQSDIHDKPLGCKISDTHVKVGGVHLGEFYEAQILFSHRYWISRFAGWLLDQIEVNLLKMDTLIVLVGYETYFEPVLYELQQKLIDKKTSVYERYLVYEEPKYISIGEKTDVAIRYIERLKRDLDNGNVNINNIQFVFLCGISSTLSTFSKMNEKVIEELSVEKATRPAPSIQRSCFSIIQVLPEINTTNGNISYPYFFNISDDVCLHWNEKEKCAKREIKGEEAEIVNYLIDVKCHWKAAEMCEWCFPKENQQERPIIEVSDTSIVPLQMIHETRSVTTSDNDRIKPITMGEEFFRKNSHGYCYADYLYYNHVVRDDHHYLYYVRTAHFCAKFYDEKKSQIRRWASQVRSVLQPSTNNPLKYDKTVNIIIYPRHFSNEMFPQIINEFVFDKKAHLISLEVNKEFRSNFETKYSNYSYFLEQIKSVKNADARLNFYYVDDQLITGATYERTKSLLSSLMKNKDKEKIKIFSGVFIFLNRMSKETKKNYVTEPEKEFFSFIDICIPSVRSYGDSCPMCKIIEESKRYQKVSILNNVAYHWAEKQYYHRQKPLIEIKKEIENEESHKDKQERRFIRFYCENLLWKGFEKGNLKRNEIVISCIKDCQTKEEFLSYFYWIIKNTIESNEEKAFDYLISLVKAISRPFIYYKENAKKATLILLRLFIDKLIASKAEDQADICISYEEINSCYSFTLRKIENGGKIAFNAKNNYERYILLVVLINSLASIDSTYLLNIERVLRMYNWVVEIQRKETIDLRGRFDKQSLTKGSLCSFIDEYNEELVWLSENINCVVPSFYSVVLNAYKRVICGISGREKCERFLKNSLEYMDNNNYTRDNKNKIIIEDYSNSSGRESVIVKEWFKLSLIQAMFLESVFETGEPINISEKDVLLKYRKLLKRIKEQGTDQSIRLGLWYYNSRLNNGLHDKDLFLIETDGDFIVDDEKTSFKKLLNSEKEEQKLREIVNRIGYAESNHKWIFKLGHYTIQDFDESYRNRDFKERECVYLSIYTQGDDIKDDLDAIRSLLRNRYHLSELIQEDIDNGAIKSSIQAEGTRKLIASDKIFNHFNIESLADLYKMAVYNIINSNSVENKEMVYKMISVFMNRCIGFGGAREILHKYFNDDNRDNSNAFELGVGYRKDVNENYFVDYIEYIKDKTNFKKIYCISNDSITQHSIMIEGIESFCETRFPKIIGTDDLPNGSAPYQLVLIGIIDVLLKNAIKHGSHEQPIKIRYEKMNDQSKEEYEYRIIVENHFKKHNKSNYEKEDGGNKPVKLTKLFFSDYLERTISNVKWRVFWDVNPLDMSDTLMLQQAIFEMKKQTKGVIKNEQ